MIECVCGCDGRARQIVIRVVELVFVQIVHSNFTFLVLVFVRLIGRFGYVLLYEQFVLIAENLIRIVGYKR